MHQLPSPRIPVVVRPSAKPRFSPDEFCHLMESRLRELESRAEASRYGAVLAALRENLAAYQTRPTVSR